MSAETPPETPSALLRRAGELETAGRYAEAEVCLDQCLDAAPALAEAWHLKGVVAASLGRIAEGATFIERALEVGPPQGRYQRNLCEIYRLLGRNDEALRMGRASVAADPGDPLGHINLSVLHYARGEPAAARASAERALAINPQIPSAHMGLAEALLAQGEFERGWEEYDWRFRIKGVPPPMPLPDIPPWDGSALKGRLLLVADQGFGDGIQFARYIAWAAERSDEVVLAASRDLLHLLGGLPGVASTFELWDAAPSCQAWATLSGLPRLHQTRLDTIPGDTPYLHADPARAAAWRERLDGLVAPGHRRIGVVWAGRPEHRNDANRSARLADFAPLAALDGVTLVSLQAGPTRGQIADYFGRAPLINLGAAVTDFADTLAIVDGLERVVSVDTAVAHLAGAAGKPVSIMLPHASDWRWLRDRADTPWYPTARLFRRAPSQTWLDVVQAVAEAIV